MLKNIQNYNAKTSFIVRQMIILNKFVEKSMNYFSKLVCIIIWTKLF